MAVEDRVTDLALIIGFSQFLRYRMNFTEPGLFLKTWIEPFLKEGRAYIWDPNIGIKQDCRARFYESGT